MRTIIAGSRGIKDYGMLLKCIAQLSYEPTVILSGGAQGVDRLGERYAREHGLVLERYIPDWVVNGRYDNSAGYERNTRMAMRAQCLIALWDGKSRGTQHMIEVANRVGLTTFVLTKKKEKS